MTDTPKSEPATKAATKAADKAVTMTPKASEPTPPHISTPPGTKVKKHPEPPKLTAEQTVAGHKLTAQPHPGAVKFGGEPKSLDERREDAGIAVPKSMKPESRELVDSPRHSSQAAADVPGLQDGPQPESDENVDIRASSEAQQVAEATSAVTPESADVDPLARHSSEAAATKDLEPDKVLGDAPAERIVKLPKPTTSAPDTLVRELE